MKRITVNASRKYEMCIGSGLLSMPPASFMEKVRGRIAMIVSDDTVYSLYGSRLYHLLSENGIRTERFVFPHGEKSKELSTYRELVEAMCAVPMSRHDLVLALGGGVTGDLAGFAAATYQRGMDCIQIPTTLLAAVDSSVGGKTALNLDGGKNQIGAFFQPAYVLFDVDMLKTLPEEEYRNGCAEIIKYAMIGSEHLFRSIRDIPVAEQYEDVAVACVLMKRDFVEKDEYDCGARMLLNFGHTIGHAVEACSRYGIPHGKAVAIGMAVITKAAVTLGFCDTAVYERLISLLRQYGLPSETDFPVSLLAPAIMNDKKMQGDTITMVVPEKTGKCVRMKLPKNEIPAWLKAGGIR